ncbi:hypothetical protein [Serratia sp. FGI94]|uniref:hypothetical protein n=1 Tax=Serratia sp. FGI94 TaxID=671990 RepID=UPI00059CEB56|nr:hypothetical protein [Serratia sp. FGI94]
MALRGLIHPESFELQEGAREGIPMSLLKVAEYSQHAGSLKYGGYRHLRSFGPYFVYLSPNLAWDGQVMEY